MRIRKNKKLAQLDLSCDDDATPTTPHVCQLNQSPWDVLPSTSSSSSRMVVDDNQGSNISSFRSPLLQLQVVERDDSFTGNGSLGDSVGAVESSVASMIDRNDDIGKAERADDDAVIVIDDDEDCSGDDNGNRIGFQSGERVIFSCNKSDGKGWQCKNEAKEGHSMCEHHLSQLRSYNYNNNNNNASPPAPNNNPPSRSAKKAAVVAGTRRGRGRAAKKASASTAENPYEFYYYSGFGPRWGKSRRGDRAEVAKKHDATKAGGENVGATTTPSSSSQIDEEEFGYVDDEDDDGDEDGDIGGRKRMRKPLKERSLKSLM